MHRLHVHRIAAIGEVEVLLLLLLGVASAESKVALLVDLGVGLVHVLCLILLIREVFFNDVVSLHVDLLVGVVLAFVDLLHTADLLDEERITVDRVTASTFLLLLVHVAHLENVLKTIESDLDDLVVRTCKQVTERLDAAALNKVANLSRLLQTTRGGVGDGPAGFFPRLEVAVLEEVDKRGDDVGIDDSLDLGRVASGDVADSPASLLANPILSGA